MHESNDLANKDLLCDLYLYLVEMPDNLTLIRSLRFEEARNLARKWFEAGENRDYMLVTSGSKPYDGTPNIYEVPSTWVDDQ